MIAHGLAHSLRELGRYRETEEVAYAWREPLINNAILFIDVLERDLTREIPPYIEPERLRRYGQVTLDLASGEGAQALAWYAYNTCQLPVAYDWFERANAWSPKEATAYGLALVTRKLKKDREFVDIVNRYDGLFPKVVELLFPDNFYHPPTPCDLLNASPREKQRLTAMLHAGGAAPAPVGLAQARSSYAMAREAGFAVAGREQFEQQGDRRPWRPQAFAAGVPIRPDVPPKLDRGVFPVSVNPENPLRAVSSGKNMSAPAAFGLAAAVQDMGAASEPWRGAQPLVARRAPGVGPMPYERYGYSLLAGWNGVQTASAPHNSETAPVGSLWTTLQARDAQSTRGGDAGIDALRQDFEGALRAIAAAPQVPSPSSLQTYSGGFFVSGSAAQRPAFAPEVIAPAAAPAVKAASPYSMLPGPRPAVATLGAPVKMATLGPPARVTLATLDQPAPLAAVAARLEAPATSSPLARLETPTQQVSAAEASAFLSPTPIAARWARLAPPARETPVVLAAAEPVDMTPTGSMEPAGGTTSLARDAAPEKIESGTSISGATPSRGPAASARSATLGMLDHFPPARSDTSDTPRASAAPSAGFSIKPFSSPPAPRH